MVSKHHCIDSFLSFFFFFFFLRKCNIRCKIGYSRFSFSLFGSFGKLIESMLINFRSTIRSSKNKSNKSKTRVSTFTQYPSIVRDITFYRSSNIEKSNFSSELVSYEPNQLNKYINITHERSIEFESRSIERIEKR